MVITMWLCERCGIGVGLCSFCKPGHGGVSVYWKTYFYGKDGFILEKDIYDLEPDGDHQTYRLRSWCRVGDGHLQALDRHFRMVVAFLINRQNIAYYEEIC